MKKDKPKYLYPKWEYKRIYILEDGHEQLEALYNQLGQEGWELQTETAKYATFRR